jgi:L-ornithine N5-monooxygenase
MYKMLYLQKLSGPNTPPQNRIIANADISSVVPLLVKADMTTKTNTPPPSVRLTISSILSTGSAPETREYAAVFLGTGYHRPPSSLAFLSGLAPHFPALSNFLAPLDADAPKANVHLITERNYTLAPREAWRAKVFVLGFGERTHGLSEGLLSIGAVRAGEVMCALDSEPVIAIASGSIEVTESTDSASDTTIIRSITPEEPDTVRV